MNLKPFSEISKDDVGVAGGKGATLGDLTRAGMPVPPGFVVCGDTLENEAILKAFDALGVDSVAVRSSATVEDSTEHSWAGQFDSYLNVRRDELLDSITKCRASLNNERAVAYRNERGLDGIRIAMAVVIQKMIPSEISGVTFTVHPVTKDPNQMVIEACWGLCEQIVSGAVTPDSYVVDKRDGSMISAKVSEQDDAVRGQKLDAAQIFKLGDICKAIEKHFGFPCDIEWAFEKGKFHILQSRPITTL